MASPAPAGDPADGDGSPGPFEEPRPARRGGIRRELAIAGVVVAAVALAGVPVGFAWYMIAPRATEMPGDSGPVPVDPENPAYFAADGWFAMLTAGVGLLTGILAYLWLARRYRDTGTYHGPAVMLSVAAGAMLAAFVALHTGRLADGWFGEGTVAASGGGPGGAVAAALNLRTTAAVVLWPLTAVLELAMLESFLPTIPGVKGERSRRWWRRSAG